MERYPSIIRYETVSDALIEFLPELHEAYQSHINWWGSQLPGPHVVYGDILNPYIDELLRAKDETTLRRVFDFIERLSLSDDKRVQDLVAVTVCEHLGNDNQRLRDAIRYMGDATLKHCHDVESFWKDSPTT